jgi:hypothetical protein
MEATHMPPVDNHFCDAPANEKAPRWAGLFSMEDRLTDFGDVCRLRSFLTLNHFEFYLIPLGERLETGSTDSAEMNKDIRTALA